MLESKPGVFPDLFVSMVAAGEASGTLDQILIRVSDHFANANKTNNKVKGALVYPVILLILALAVIILMFTAILPTFANMMSPDDMTPLSRAMLSFSDSLINHWYIYLIVIGVIILLFWVGRKTPSVKLKMDELILRMPKVGKLISTIYTGRFARNMSNLYAAGLQMVDCIEKSVSVLGNSYVNKRFEEVVDNIKLGESMSKAVEKTGIFEGMFTSIIFVGEESGTLDTILSKAADYYEEEGDTAITKLVGMLEPVMIIIMGVAIGLVLAAIFPMLYGGMTNVS
mgnify:FL=1